ncbi:MAG: hypothetical protein WAM98_18145 [Terriglobales bacterium]
MRIRKSFESGSLYKAALTVLAVLVSVSVAYAKTPTRQQGGGPVSLVSHAYGAFWQVGNGYSSELVLKNNDPRNVAAVQVTLFGNTGQQSGSAQIQIAANSVNRVDLASIIGPQGGSGGLMLEFVGVVPQIAGKIVIVDSQRGTSIELPLQGGYRYDTANALYAPWWLPDEGTEGRITLFNSSAQAVVVSASLTVDRVERILDSVALKPHETKELSLRDLMRKMEVQGAITGSVTLRYSGPAHALQPGLLLTSRGTGFVLVPAFNGRRDRQAGAETTWLFPDVQLLDNTQPAPDEGTPLESYALLSNGTKASLVPELVAYFGGAAGSQGQKVTIPIDPLRPLETRLVDLAQLLGNTKSTPAKLSRFALGTSHAGAPGDLGITVFSMRPTKDFVSRSAGIILPPGVVDTSYWQIAGNQPAAVQNDGGSAARTGVTLYYQTPYGVQSYSLNPIDVPGKKSEKLSLAESIHSEIADRNGKRVPSGTVFGIATLGLVSGDDSGAMSVGSPPECMSDCGPAPLLSSLSTTAVAVSGQTEHVRFAELQPEDCTGPIITGSSNTVWWFNGQNPNPTSYPISVTLKSSGGEDTVWDAVQADTKVKLSSISGSQITVTSTGTHFSAAVGDISIYASLNGVGGPSPFTMTARTPWKLGLLSRSTVCDSSYGYCTDINYNVLDNLSSVIADNIYWSEGIQACQSANGSNWGSICITTGSGSTPPVDGLCGPALSDKPSPVPKCDKPPTGTTPYENVPQQIQVGSDTFGSGVLAQTDTLTYYIDQGNATGVTSPSQPPQ